MVSKIVCPILVIFVLLSLCNLHEVLGRTSESLKVKLPHGGVLVGRHLTSVKGRHVRGYLGIPYAKPPVNELRFKPPVPYGSWQGEKHAIADSPICIQRDPFRRDPTTEGSEDCLYLNVYVPERSPNDKKPLPVMVWFHGGGWQCGSGISAFYGPDHLMDHDVIYVSGNFRLGPLGFLSTETVECPGNNGMKDQVEILKWVKENIAAFGGNPGSVTIFGESAGGASVTYHMASPLSKGLFHRGISQSGTYFNPWAQPTHKGVAAARARKVAKTLNCENSDWSKVLDCLRTKSAEELMATIYEFFEWDTDPMIPFPPVVEPEHEGAFLTESVRSIKRPHGQSIPWMAGATSEEGALKTAALLNIPGLLDDLKDKYEKVIPIVLNYDHHSKDIQEAITKKIDSFYFNNKHDWSKANQQNLTNLFTDAWFVGGFDEYVRLRLSEENRQGTAPTFLYLFDHKGSASFTEIFKGGRDEYYGVCHADELQYLFPIGKALFVSAVPTKQDLEIREAMLELWVSFARNGNPTPPSTTPPNLIKWKVAKKYPVNYVRIGSQDLDGEWQTMRNEENLLQARVDFWDQLKPHVAAEEFNQVTKDEL